MALAPIIKANAQLVHASNAPLAPGAPRNYNLERRNQLDYIEAQNRAKMEADAEAAKMANQFQTARDARLNGFQTARDAQAHMNRMEAIGAETEAWKQRTDYGYSAKQRQQYSELQEIRNTLLDSGAYSKDDIDAMMPAVEMRMNGIRDNPERLLPQDRQPVPELQFSQDGKFYFDDAGGRWTPMPETGFKITPAEAFQQQRQLSAEKAYYTALQNWRTAKAKHDSDPEEPDPGPQPTMLDFVGQIRSMPAATKGLPIQSVGLRTNAVPQSVSQPVAPNPQVIQSVGPNATPEQRARNWADRLRKQ